MRNAKKWVALLITISCVFALAACGSSKVPDATTPPLSAAPSESTTTKESSTPDEGSKPQTTLSAESKTSESGGGEIRIRLTFDGGEAIAVLEDNPTTQSLLAQLPATVKFTDYGGAEKIAYFPEDLSREGAPDGYDPVVSDVACYGPWGNLVIYYDDAPYANGIIPMGHMESGLDALSEHDADFEATIEIIE